MKRRTKSRQSRVVQLPSTSSEPQKSPDETLKPETQPQDQLSQEQKAKIKAVQKNFADLTVALRAMNAQVQYLTQQQSSDSILLATMEHLDEDLGKFVDAMWAIRQVLESEIPASER